MSEVQADSTDVNYQGLLWDVLDTSIGMEKIQKELKVVQEHVTGTEETAKLEAIQKHLTGVLAVFSKVYGRSKAADYCAQLPGREELLSELSEESDNASLAMLPEMSWLLDVIANALAHISDVVVPVPPCEGVNPGSSKR